MLPRVSLKSLLDWGSRELSELGPIEAKASAERLLEEVLGLERTFLYLNAAENVPQKQAAHYRRLIGKRKARIPVGYILRKASFWDEVLEVQPGCLIPRPETEILVDAFIRKSGFQKQSSFSFLDLGTGTGAIGIALLRYFPNASAAFSDISLAALKVTRRNLKKYGLLTRAKVVRSDLFKAFAEKAESVSWDAIVSNPPYVAKADLAGLEPELKAEPRLALDGGRGGLFFYRQILRQAQKFLRPGGLIVFEMGAGQAAEIGKLISKNGYTQKLFFKDFLGITRVVMAHASKAD